MAVATLDGVMHLVHPGPGNPLLLTETFSIAGVMTPSQPVSYKSADSATVEQWIWHPCGGWLEPSVADLWLALRGWRRAGHGARWRRDPAAVRPRPGAPVELRIGRYE